MFELLYVLMHVCSLHIEKTSRHPALAFHFVHITPLADKDDRHLVVRTPDISAFPPPILAIL